MGTLEDFLEDTIIWGFNHQKYGDQPLRNNSLMVIKAGNIVDT